MLLFVAVFSVSASSFPQNTPKPLLSSLLNRGSLTVWEPPRSFDRGGSVSISITHHSSFADSAWLTRSREREVSS